MFLKKSCNHCFLGLVVILFLSCSCRKTDKEKLATDAFIAHAGGAIAGHKLTNSLEAMNLSYEKGCRLFELDIIETSDGKYVAAHGWNDFKMMTGFPGAPDDSPLTEEQFLSLKIHGRFQPMNMTVINEWFALHEDAILVTDKINEPELFSEAFLFRDRLIMELFSWEAVHEAVTCGIPPILSENLAMCFEEKKETVTGLGIEYVAVSQTTVMQNKTFFKILKEQGIKTYVYGLTEKRDEKYVLKHVAKYIYGMYADNLDWIHCEDSCS